MKQWFCRSSLPCWVVSGLLLPVWYISCDKQVTEPYVLDYGFDYFPLEVGKYRVFYSDSILYDPIANGVERDTVSVWIRETVSDTFFDINQQLHYVIERAQKYEPAEPWEITDIWFAVRDSQKAILSEDNMPFIKLTFPVKKFQSWDGNSLLEPGTIVEIRGETIEMFKNWAYEVTDIVPLDTTGVDDFADVAIVQQADDENLIEKRFAMEKYARGIGLIYRELWILDTQIIDPLLPWDQKAQKGFILRQQLIEHN